MPKVPINNSIPTHLNPHLLQSLLPFTFFHFFLFLYYYFRHGSSFFHRRHKGKDPKPPPKTGSYQGSDFWEPCQFSNLSDLHGRRDTLQTHPRPYRRWQSHRCSAALPSSAAAPSSYLRWRLRRHVIYSTSLYNCVLICRRWDFCCALAHFLKITLYICNFLFFSLFFFAWCGFFFYSCSSIRWYGFELLNFFSRRYAVVISWTMLGIGVWCVNLLWKFLFFYLGCGVIFLIILHPLCGVY